MRNSTLKTLCEWIGDPVGLARFEEVACLSPRTSFVKSLLNLSESDEFVRGQMQSARDRRGVAGKLSRGAPLGMVNVKSLKPTQRYMASVLLSWMLNSDDGGLSAVGGDIVGVDLVDRLVYVYKRYLNYTGTPVESADVGFELFVLVFRCYTMAEIDVLGCDNCGSNFISTRQGHAMRCPVCDAHAHPCRSKKIPQPRLPELQVRQAA